MTFILQPTIYDAIRSASDAQNVQFALSTALAIGESGLQPGVVAGNRYTLDELRDMESTYPAEWWERASVAVGLFQLHTMGAGHGLSVAQLIDPSISADRGVAYLRSMLDATGSEIEALSAYNQGLYGFQQRGILDEQRGWINAVLAQRDYLVREGIGRRGTTPPRESEPPISSLPALPTTVPPPTLPPIASGEEVHGILDNLDSRLGTIIDWLREHFGALGQSVADALDSLRSGIRGAIQGAYDRAAGGIASATTAISAATEAGLLAASAGLSASSEAIGNSVRDALNTAYATIAAVLTPLAIKVRDGFDFAHSAMDQIVEAIASRVDSIASAISQLRSDFVMRVGDVFGSVASTINGLLEKSKDWYMQTVSDAAASLGAVRDALVSQAQGIIDGVMAGFEWFSAQFIPALKTLASDIGNAIWSGLFSVDITSEQAEQFVREIRQVAALVSGRGGA